MQILSSTAQAQMSLRPLLPNAHNPSPNCNPTPNYSGATTPSTTAALFPEQAWLQPLPPGFGLLYFTTAIATLPWP